MKKTFIGLIVFLLVLGMVFAGKPNPVEKVNPAGKTVSIPAHAVEVAPGVFYLGKALDNGRVVEGYAIFAKPRCGDGKCHPSENSVTCPEDCGEVPEPPVPFCGDGECNGDETPETCPNDCPTDPEPDTSSCYTFLASGAKWKTVEDYIVDPTNTRGLDEGFVGSNLAMDINKWEAAANFNILGNEIAGTVDILNIGNLNSKNEVLFADIDSPGAIGVTIIWGIFGGPPRRRELVEWDMVFDDVDFDWGIGEAGKMDFENIATHELGHSVGLGDLYTDECIDQTMYGYASYGETKKRTLEAGDIAGINALY